MKAPDFAYARPQTVQEALALIADPDREAMVLAGGQSLMPMMNLRLAAPELLVDLNRIPELVGIEDEGDALKVGAMTRYSAVLASEAVATHAPLLAAALPHVAHAAIRNRGTVGGSVALADPAAELPAVLLALEGRVLLCGSDGEREVAADDFFTGLYETARQDDELVAAIRIPKANGARHAFHELARRHGDYAVAGVAVAWGERPRIALFAVSDKPMRAEAAEEALAGRDPGDGEAVAAAVSALDGLTFAGDLNADEATKRHLAGVVLRRALASLPSAAPTALAA